MRNRLMGRKESKMREFVISADSTAGLPEKYKKDNGIDIHPLHYIIDGKEYGMDLGEELTDKEFYDCIRKGKMPTTSATNPEYIRKVMEKQLAEGKDILHLGFSSGLSSSYANAHMVAEELKEEYPEAKIVVIDTLSAECGHALLVYMAVEMKKQGKSLEEIAEWIEANKLHVIVHFTVEDLFHLVRGGRLAKSTAVLGTALSIKPILHMDNEGKLESISKTRGRKKAMKVLVDTIETNTEGFEVKHIFISHSDCEEDAKEMERYAKEKYPEVNTWVLPISPTVGAHTGVGSLVIAYFGNVR